MSTRIGKQAEPKGKMEIVPRDPNAQHPFLLMVDGVVRRVGTQDECKEFAQILAERQLDPRPQQDHALKRIFS